MDVDDYRERLPQHLLVPPAGQTLAEWRAAVATHAQVLLAQAESSPQPGETRALWLALHGWMAATAKAIFQAPEVARAWLETGLAQAEAWLARGENHPEVRVWTLGLALDGGITLSQLPRKEEAGEVYRRGLAWAERFLDAGETASGVRKTALDLAHNAGFALGQRNRPEEALAAERRGLAWADAFLVAGETESEVRRAITELKAHELASLHNQGHAAAEVAALPFLGGFTWAEAGHLPADHWPKMQEHWHAELEQSPHPARFTHHTETFLRALLLRWHAPNQPHRHFAYLESPLLARLGRGLYAAAQARAQARASQAARGMIHLWEENVAERETLATALARLGPPRKPVWWRLDGWWSHWAREDQRDHYRARRQALRADWDQQAPKAAKALRTGLRDGWLDRLRLSAEGLHDLPSAVLGLVLLGEAQARAQEPAEVVATWRDDPPWRDANRLRAALDAWPWRDWGQDADNPLPPLYTLTLHPPGAHRLNVADDPNKYRQPSLLAWLQALDQGDTGELAPRLAEAWRHALAQAEATAKRISETDADALFPAALAAILQGQSPAFLQQHAQTVLESAAPGLEPRDLQDRFGQFLHHLPPWRGPAEHANEPRPKPTPLPSQPPSTKGAKEPAPAEPVLEDAIHGWHQTWLGETLAKSGPLAKDLPATVWDILEHSRLALHGLHVPSPEDWDAATGDELWTSFKNTYPRIEHAQANGYSLEAEIWPPLRVWLERVEALLPGVPASETCRARLGQAVLAQPFFDPEKQILRVLWLDAAGLAVRDAPTEAAARATWDALARQWVAKAEVQAFWDHPAARALAGQLRAWAGEAATVWIIWPAPLGQFPWEGFAELAERAGRAVSARHWLATKSEAKKGEGAWVANLAPLATPVATAPSDTTRGEFQPLPCGGGEARAVAKAWRVEVANAPPPSTVLQQLRGADQVFLIGHGGYEPGDPARSGLYLGHQKSASLLPLWACAAHGVAARRIFLSACQTNLGGQTDTQFLAPLGLGPGLAAAGAREVIGTLWETDDVATLIFTVLFLRAEAQDPNQPGRVYAARARNEMRALDPRALKALLPSECEDGCRVLVDKLCLSAKPLNDPRHWAGFVVLGGD